MHTENAMLAALTATAICLGSVLDFGRGCPGATTLAGKVPADIRAIESAGELYAAHHGRSYPDDLARLVERGAGGWSYLRLGSVPLDPWGRLYLYAPTDLHCRHPRIGTLGRDGTVGGDGEDRDVDNWMLRAGFEAR